MLGRANWRNAVAFAHDLVAAAAAWVLAYLFRFNFEVESWYVDAMASNLVWIIPAQGLLSVSYTHLTLPTKRIV